MKINGDTEIQSLMTLCPCTVELTNTLSTVRELMEKHKIRHLPVVSQGKVVGIVSHRELQFAIGCSYSKSVEFDVRDIYSPEPIVVTPTTSLREVTAIMAREHVGCVIVHVEDRAVGIFTTTDVCQICSEVI